MNYWNFFPCSQIVKSLRASFTPLILFNYLVKENEDPLKVSCKIISHG